MKFALIIAGLLSLTLLNGCSASVHDGTPNNPVAPKPEDFSHKVAGPSLDGTWNSDCVVDKWTNGYIKFSEVIKGQNITRIETQYSDFSCTLLTNTVTRTGLFRYKLAVGSSGIYEVEYKFSAGSGGSYYTGENIELFGKSLYISDRYTGPLVTPEIELQRAATLDGAKP